MLIGDDDPANGSLRGATVLSGRVDRSPCGTGNSARLALLAARGKADVGSRFIARSLIDSEFIVEMIGETTVGDRAGGAAADLRQGLGGRHAHELGRPHRSVPARLSCSATCGATRSARC